MMRLHCQSSEWGSIEITTLNYTISSQRNDQQKQLCRIHPKYGSSCLTLGASDKVGTFTKAWCDREFINYISKEYIQHTRARA